MPALMLLQSLGEAVVARGLKGLMGFVPFGEQVYEIAKGTVEIYRRNQRDAKIVADAEEMLKATMEEIKAEAKSISERMGNEHKLAPEEVIQLESLLTQIPSVARQCMKRQQDPSGTTVPFSFDLKDPVQLSSILPKRTPMFKVGQQVPHSPGYVFSEILGSGGFGEVWLAQHTFLDQRRAFKFCLDAQARERLLRHEGEVVKRVMSASKSVQDNEHGIVPLIDAYLEGETPWLAYQYVEGGDLSALVREMATLPPPKRAKIVLELLIDLAEVVGKFHRLPQPIIHRDLKPANILLRKNGNSWVIRVTDFGISHVAAQQGLQHASVSTPNMNLGDTYRGAHTPIYASPQQKKNAPPDVRDDVHAIGIIGYQLLLGDLTAERPSGQSWKQKFALHKLPSGILELLEQCFDDEASVRPKDALELASKLKALVKNQGAPPPPINQAKKSQRPPIVPEIQKQTEKDTPDQPSKKKRSKKFKVLASLGLVAILLIILSVWLIPIFIAQTYDAETLFNKGMASYSTDFSHRVDRKAAAYWFRKSAEKGHVEAMRMLGKMYEEDGAHNEITRNPKEAFKWYKMAAEQGDAFSMNRLGWLSQYGEIGYRDIPGAENWYLRAANLGNPDAMCNLGDLYAYEPLIKRDWQKSRGWYEKAAKAGSYTAERRLNDGIGPAP